MLYDSKTLVNRNDHGNRSVGIIVQLIQILSMAVLPLIQFKLGINIIIPPSSPALVSFLKLGSTL